MLTSVAERPDWLMRILAVLGLRIFEPSPIQQRKPHIGKQDRRTIGFGRRLHCFNRVYRRGEGHQQGVEACCSVVGTFFMRSRRTRAVIER